MRLKFLLSTTLIILASTALFSALSPRINAQQPSEPQPVFYASFDGTLNATTRDYGTVSPTCNPWINIKTIPYEPGIKGSALDLGLPPGTPWYELGVNYSQPDGKGDFLNRAHGTVEFWLRPSENWEEGNSSQGWPFAEPDSWIPNLGNCTFLLLVNQGVPVPSLILQIFNSNGTGSWAIINIGTSWNEGEWHHVAFTWEYDGTSSVLTAKVYIDGQLQDQIPYRHQNQKVECNDWNPELTKNNFYVGLAPNNVAIDELKIYDVALSGDTIKAHYLELFPVEFYASETVFYTNLPGQQVNVQITNTGSGTIQGVFGCTVRGGTATSVTRELPANGSMNLIATLGKLTEGEHYLDCYFSPASTPNGPNGGNRTIRLFAIPQGTHPYLFFDGKDISDLRVKAKTTHNSLWTSIREFVDPRVYDVLAVPESGIGEETGLGIIPFAFAYVITGDTTYAELVKNCLMTYAGYSSWIGNGGRALSRMIIGNSIAYDWIYNYLNDTERATIRNAIANATDAEYPEASGRASSANTNWAWSMCSGLLFGGLVLEGEDSRANSTWVPRGIDGLERIMACANGWKDGACPEGVSYYQEAGIMDVLSVLYALRRVENKDLISDSVYFKQYPTWRIQISLPAEMDKYIMHYGDGRIDAWSSPITTVFLRFSASEYNNGYAEWMAEQIRNIIGYPGTNGRGVEDVVEFLFYNASVAPKDPRAGFPPRYYASNLEAVILRSGWNNDDMVFAIKASAIGSKWDYFNKRDGVYPFEDPATRGYYEYDHVHWDSLGFYIYRNGAWLAPEEIGYRSYSPINAPSPRDTSYHNTLLVDGQGQYGETIGTDEWDCDIDKFFQAYSYISLYDYTKDYDYIVANGTGSYLQKNQPQTITEFTRHILYIRPNYFILIDNIKATEDHSYQWVCHMGENITVNGNWIKGDSTNNQILGINVVSPSQWTYTVGRHDTGTAVEQTNEYPFIQVSPASKVADTRYITVLYPTDTSNWSSKPTVSKIGETNQAAGVKLIYNDKSEDNVYMKYGASIDVTIGDCTFDGTTVVVKRNPSGGLASIFLSAGTALTYEGTNLITAPSSQNIEVTYAGKTLSLYGDSVALNGTRIYAPGVTNVMVNDNLVPFEREGDYIVVHAGLIGDLNGDRVVNILDISIVARAFNSHGPDIPKLGDPASPNWNETADVDKNGIVNILDIAIVAKDYGKTA